MSENIIEAPKRRGPLYAVIAVVVAAVVVAGFLIFGGGDSDAKGKPVKIGVVGAERPVLGDLQGGRSRRGHRARGQRLRRLHPAQPGADRGRARPQPVPAHRLPRRLQRRERRRPGADRLDRDLPARSLLRRSTTRSTTSRTARPSSSRTTTSNQARGLLRAAVGRPDRARRTAAPSSPPSTTSTTPRRKVKVRALEAAITATSLPDVAAAIINNDFVEDAGLTFEDAHRARRPVRPEGAALRQHLRRTRRGQGQRDLQKLVEIFQTNEDVQRGRARDLRRHRRARRRPRSPTCRRRCEGRATPAEHQPGSQAASERSRTPDHRLRRIRMPVVGSATCRRPSRPRTRPQRGRRRRSTSTSTSRRARSYGDHRLLGRRQVARSCG